MVTKMMGVKIGEGGCSEIFEWGGAQKVIKIGKKNTDFDAMKKEFNNHQLAWEYGLPVPRPYELLNINGRPGIVFDRIHGETLMEQFTRFINDQLDGIGNENPRVTARILSEVHNISNPPSIPSQRETMKSTIRSVEYLSRAEKDQVIDRLDKLPMKQKLCHGDPNPGNILISEGEAIIIDWMNATAGNPEADLAEYIIMIRYAILPPQLSVSKDAVCYFDSIRERIIKMFCVEYFRLTGITYDEAEKWIVPVAARKLSADAISCAEKELLVKEIRNRIK